MIGRFILLTASAGGWWVLRAGLPWLRGTKAYVFAFSLIVMDLTKEAATASTAGEITAPVNQFAVMTNYPDASFRAVPRTGLDTLFAVAWADRRKAHGEGPGACDGHVRDLQSAIKKLRKVA